MDQLLQTLQVLHTNAMTSTSRPFAPRYGAEVYGSALESRTIPSQYSWDCLKRNGDPDHPFVIFQYTLSGYGHLVEQGTAHKVPPQTAFIAAVPSDCRYYLSPESSGWTFFWLIIHHPYVVSRILQRKPTIDTVFNLAPNSMLIARAIQILQGIYSETFHDAFAEEQALFDFLIEYERLVYNLRYSQSERERLLEDVRSYVLKSLDQSIEVKRIAESYSMSRSHFSHYFKDSTGIAPVQFITQVRLEEATRQLLHTNLTLQHIAAATGFANANHFCKVFRRHFHLSPGVFRRQMRSGQEVINPPFPSPGEEDTALLDDLQCNLQSL